MASEDSDQIRRLRARMASNESWARTEDRAARTWPARKAMLDRFEKQVDPEGKLTPQERAKRAEWARKAHMQRLALKSVAARQRRCPTCGQPKDPDAPSCPRCLRKIRVP
jgi:rubrerythrin